MTNSIPVVTNDDNKPTCRVVGAGAEFTGKNGHMYAPGIFARSVGARKINLQIVAIQRASSAVMPERAKIATHFR